MNTLLKKHVGRPRGRGKGMHGGPAMHPSDVLDELVEIAEDDLVSILDVVVHDTAPPHDEIVVVDDEEEEEEDEEERPVRRIREVRNRADDFADEWMRLGGKAPLLTPARELVLAHRVEHGDERAKEELINANVRLVASVARKYMGRGLPLEDLMQEGLIGLMRAIEKYNYRKGYRFSTYATHWIRQAITRALANQGRSIRLPAHVVDAIGRVTRVREELFHKLGRVPTRIELAEAAGVTEKKLLHLLKSAAQPVSLEAPVGAEGEARLGDFVPAGEESSPSDRAFKYLVKEELEHALNTLNPREKEVLVLRYGLYDEEPHTLEETGKRLHITRERARQIEAKAMEKLRRPHTVGRLATSMT